MRNQLSTFAWLTACSALIPLVAGCGSPVPTPAAPTPGTSSASSSIPDPTKYTDAGVEVKQVPVQEAALATQVAMKYGPTRPDPFALEPAERQYDFDQSAERVFGEVGGFTNEFTPTVPVEEAPPSPETQPYRRLAGVVVGDSIVALISMEDGQSFIIYPGFQLPAPYSQWRVKSIDLDQAVLERSFGNPRDVTVRLESPPGGGTPTGFGGGVPGGPGGLGGPGVPGGPGGFGGGFRPGAGGFGGGGK